MIHRHTLTRLAADLRARKLSSVELVRTCLGRIEASQPALNAFISITAEQALMGRRWPFLILPS